MSTDLVTDARLDEALSEAKPTLVEFYSRKAVKDMEDLTVMEQLREKFQDKANVLTVNADSSEDLVNKYHVHSYPTWILFKDGQECWRDGGRKPLSELTDMIHRFE